jgi:hypothetical protein
LLACKPASTRQEGNARHSFPDWQARLADRSSPRPTPAPAVHTRRAPSIAPNPRTPFRGTPKTRPREAPLKPPANPPPPSGRRPSTRSRPSWQRGRTCSDPSSGELPQGSSFSGLLMGSDWLRSWVRVGGRPFCGGPKCTANPERRPRNATQTPELPLLPPPTRRASRFLLNNRHRVSVVMLPDPALAARTEAAEKERLEAARAALAREQAGALARGGGGGGGGGGGAGGGRACLRGVCGGPATPLLRATPLFNTFLPLPPRQPQGLRKTRTPPPPCACATSQPDLSRSSPRPAAAPPPPTRPSPAPPLPSP